MATKAEERLIEALASHEGFNEGSLWKVRIEVVESMIDALHKHGRPTMDPNRGVATLAEELGEVAECAIEATRPIMIMSKDAKSAGDTVSHLRDMNHELSQLAAYAMLLMMSMRILYHDIQQKVEFVKGGLVQGGASADKV